jgi:hypothetical protein
VQYACLAATPQGHVQPSQADVRSGQSFIARLAVRPTIDILSDTGYNTVVLP